jgi:hypothetical protein
VTAVGVANVAKFLHGILIELGLQHLNATTLVDDNVDSIVMANARRPTDRNRHIDIQNFALQDRVRQGGVLLEYIRGTINTADAWVLHHRHCTRMMGMCRLPFTPQGLLATKKLN